MSNRHDGSAKMPKTIKAGCGIRFDPDDLSEDTSFDFSDAAKWLEATRDDGESGSESGHSGKTEPGPENEHPDHPEKVPESGT